jgi:hypothetical protein
MSGRTASDPPSIAAPSNDRATPVIIGNVDSEFIEAMVGIRGTPASLIFVISE